LQTVTMEDVARKAGVSRALVSLAYRDAYGVSPETREHILAVGKRLGYRPNRVAAQLAGKEQLTIGVFLQDLHNDVFAQVYDGIREVTDAAGKHSVLAVGKLDGSKDVDALETLLESRVDIVIAAGLVLSDKDLKRYTSRLDLVSVMREVAGADSVCSNNRVGAELATEHLIAQGHKRILFLCNPPSDGYLERAEGYQRAMRAAKLNPVVVEGSYSREVNAKLALELLSGSTPAGETRPTAIFAHNDQAALGVQDAAIQLSLQLGKDLAVVGYDNSALSQSPSAPLTTVDVHGFELGKAAATMALQRLENPKTRQMIQHHTPSLVVRSSSSSPLS